MSNIQLSPADSGGEDKKIAVRLEGVAKRYGQVTAVDGLDLSLHEGEIVALLGPNGAGKTTTVHLMLGLIPPTRGTVRVFGKDPSLAETRMHIGAVMQDARVPGNITVREYIELFSSYYPEPLAYAEVLRLSGLEKLDKRRASRLSEGERQRLRFAMAICGWPSVLYLDEPTANLDVEARRRFWDCVQELSTKNRSILFTTHNLEEADKLAHRIVLLNEGKVIHQGAPQQIRALIAIQHISCRTKASLEAVQRLEGVKEARYDGGYLKVVADHQAPITRDLYALDPQLEDLVVERARLEDAFLMLLRDQQALGMSKDEKKT